MGEETRARIEWEARMLRKAHDAPDDEILREVADYILWVQENRLRRDQA